MEDLRLVRVERAYRKRMQAGLVGATRTARRLGAFALGIGIALGCGDDKNVTVPGPNSGGAPAPSSGGAAVVPGGGGGGGASSGGSGLVPGLGGQVATGATGSAVGTGGIPATGAGGGTGGDATPLNGNVLFSVPSGMFETPFTVTMSTQFTGVEIRYTMDGQNPGPSSTLYDGTPISIDETTRLVANVFTGSAVVGQAQTAFYLQRAVNPQSELPLIVIDDFGAGAPQEEVDRDAAFFVFEPTSGMASFSAAPTVAARAAFHIRGQTSVEFDKKNYRVELRDALGEDADYPLLGMPAESDWVLHGPFADKSLIRNAFAYSLGRDMGMVAPKFAFAEVYLNTDSQPVAASDYVGVYLLVESIKNSKSRLDLSQLEETDTALPDITGGYIFKFELDVAEPPILSCSGSPCWIDLEVDDPSPLNSQQQSWLTDHIQSFHDALFGNDFTNPTTGYAPFIDLNSFVNYMVLQEVGRNLDAYIRSLYFYKDRNGVITAGPLWDYNLIAGAGCCGSTVIDGWQHEIERNGDANGWFQRLVTDPAFAALLHSRYTELRAGLLSDAQIDARIDALAAPLANAAERNFQRWPNLTQETIVFFETPTASTWSGQLDAMRTWLKQRLAWLDPRF